MVHIIGCEAIRFESLKLKKKKKNETISHAVNKDYNKQQRWTSFYYLLSFRLFILIFLTYE